MGYKFGKKPKEKEWVGFNPFRSHDHGQIQFEVEIGKFVEQNFTWFSSSIWVVLLVDIAVPRMNKIEFIKKHREVAPNATDQAIEEAWKEELERELERWQEEMKRLQEERKRIQEERERRQEESRKLIQFTTNASQLPADLQ